MKLKLAEVKKAFGTKEVLKGCSFEFEQGNIYGLLGRNGAGKTTLFNCLSGDLGIDSGSACIVNADGSMEQLTATNTGYVFSTPVLPEFMTGYEFIKFYAEINRERIDPAKTIDDYFDIVKISKEDRNRLIKGYSHGMKNKVQLLGFIISRPPIILLDEPLTSFDVVVALEIKQLLRELKQEHVIIFSTHILQLATDLCDEIVVLSEGQLQQVEHGMLHSKDFEAQIIELLKDEASDD